MMHLMIEPVALTIFHLVRKSGVEPVLCDLLEYYERDEARHVGIGVHYLPKLIEESTWAEKLEMLIWQVGILFSEIDGLQSLEPDFRILGFTPDDVFSLAEEKQLESFNLLADQLGLSRRIWEPIQQIVRTRKNVVLHGRSFGDIREHARDVAGILIRNLI